MNTWFTCKVRYEKTLENGQNKLVTEPYLVDALSFTEAEARIIEEMTPFVSGGFSVSAVAKANYAELLSAEDDLSADLWYKVKLGFITIDERTGSEKKTFSNVLVQASDLRDALNRLDQSMKDSMADYVVVSVSETPIVDVFPYGNEKDAVPEFVKEV